MSRVARILIGPIAPREYNQVGSGVLVGVKGRAFVLTSWHTLDANPIPPGQALYVNFHPARPGLHHADVLYRDKRQDWVALRIPGLDDQTPGLRELSPVSVEAVASGDRVALIGFTEDRPDLVPVVVHGSASGVFCSSQPPTVHSRARSNGCPPALGRALAIQGAALRKGMSGGPAISLSTGKLVGLNQALAGSPGIDVGIVTDASDFVTVLEVLTGGP
jgi:hypothetical protein